MTEDEPVALGSEDHANDTTADPKPSFASEKRSRAIDLMVELIADQQGKPTTHKNVERLAVGLWMAQGHALEALEACVVGERDADDGD
mgnify:FL=1